MALSKLATTIQTRLQWLTSFGRMAGKTPDTDQFTWARSGEYLVFHYDLVSEDDRSAFRSDFSAWLEDQGYHIGGSVYAIRASLAKRGATLFWNRLRTQTAGELQHGDAFYLHYSADWLNKMGAIAQVVPTGRDTLDRVEVAP